ncbi:hypothetical protein ZHAS_00009193 [Anopheles sinensis]|uniref:Uncharacterized protein n=1 Tax=Anopheles sinensis TaxID=74873 RepID=A0A084VUE6_ANOSI|nr:hypothetical protein ZHAS_00009193 [Anopheles sinensis]
MAREKRGRWWGKESRGGGGAKRSHNLCKYSRDQIFIFGLMCFPPPPSHHPISTAFARRNAVFFQSERSISSFAYKSSVPEEARSKSCRKASFQAGLQHPATPTATTADCVHQKPAVGMERHGKIIPANRNIKLGP